MIIRSMFLSLAKIRTMQSKNLGRDIRSESISLNTLSELEIKERICYHQSFGTRCHSLLSRQIRRCTIVTGDCDRSILLSVDVSDEGVEDAFKRFLVDLERYHLTMRLIWEEALKNKI